MRGENLAYGEDGRKQGLVTRTIKALLRIAPVLVVALFTAVSAAAPGFAAEPPDSISVTYCEECVPFQFTNTSGEPDGMIIDYWKLWSKKTGLPVRFSAAPWSQTLAAARNGKVDAHAGLFYSDERNAYLDYGTALTSTDAHVFFHEDVAFPDTLAELKSYRIAVVAGDLVENWLKERIGDASVVGFPDYPSIIAALNAGEIKVFAADTQTGLYHLGRSDLLTKFRHQKLNPLYTSKWFVAVKKGNRQLLDTIDAGMRRIDPAERLLVARTWASGQRSEDPTSLIVAIDNNYPPLSTIGIDGTPQGLMVDIWREWSKAVGRTVRFKAGTWKQTLEDVRAGEADIHSGLFKSPDRDQWMAFSQPIHVIKTGLFTKSDAIGAKTLAAMRGKRVAAVDGTYQARFIEEQHPGVDLVKVPDRPAYLMALMRGEVSGIVEEVPTVNAGLARFGLSGSVTRQTDLFENQVFGGVRKDNALLLELVNSGFDSIPRQRLAEIEARWVPDPEDRFFSDKLGVANLTGEEKAWVAAHPEIIIAATPDWPPFEWRDETTGEHRGISADYMKLAAKKVGLQIVPEFGSWTPLVEKLKNKQIDVAPGLNRTADREKYLLFTEPFVDYFSVIFAAQDGESFDSVADLAGKTVAVEKGYALAEGLARDFPEIKLKPVDTTIQALQAVSAREVDAYVGNQLVGTHLIKKYLVANVAMTGFYNKIPGQFRFGVRDDWPILRDILNKGLAAITDQERGAIIKAHTGMNLNVGKHVRLSDAERDWLSRHPTINLGVDSGWPPFEYIDEEGTYSGLAAGYIEVLAKRLDVEMQPKPSLNWGEAIKDIENGGGAVDMLPAVAVTPERKKFLNFT